MATHSPTPATAMWDTAPGDRGARQLRRDYTIHNILAMLKTGPWDRGARQLRWDYTNINQYISHVGHCTGGLGGARQLRWDYTNIN